MTHKYYEKREIVEDLDTEPQHIIENITTDAEAEALKVEHASMQGNFEEHVVEGHHDEDSSKNVPCTKRYFNEEGKLQ